MLLDTNVVSELRKVGDGRADPHVVRFFSDLEADSLHLSAITVVELELGIAGVERRDPTQGGRLRTWMEHQVLPFFHNRILPVDAPVALRCAHLHGPDLRSERDAFIAATAMVHGLTVVTRNVADFAPIGVALLNPWEAV
ncbi:hypothetical protein SAMN05216355_102109 [Actinomyces ruminicola]|uniref:Ribonuclease VapC n=1 Tax=Actinomyces ruminicola TaxID=332524 RepID=A0A1H0ATN3_9ACTO|nr:type II toxin-antitoxin system VapC family toxin [Actinomyces ruminicola]SDN36443.1 hypothetical protein SAMN05216355_102109 [Actinomyces ruminicola]